MVSLRDKSTKINTKDDYGYTGLIHSAVNGNCKVIELLIDRGSNVNEYTISGNTALHIACEYGHMEAVRVLLSRQVDATLLNNQGQTAFDCIGNKMVYNVTDKEKHEENIIQYRELYNSGNVFGYLGV